MQHDPLEYMVLGALLCGVFFLSLILFVRKITEFQSRVLRTRFEEEEPEEHRTLLRSKLEPR